MRARRGSGLFVPGRKWVACGRLESRWAMGKYALHPDIQRELEWTGPLEQGTPKMGSLLGGEWIYG
jgi:hypothetical protein